MLFRGWGLTFNLCLALLGGYTWAAPAPPSQGLQVLTVQAVTLKKRSGAVGSAWVDAELVPAGYYLQPDLITSDPTWYSFNFKGQQRWAKRTQFQIVNSAKEAVVAQSAVAAWVLADPSACSATFQVDRKSAEAGPVRRPAETLHASDECVKFLRQFENTIRDSNGRMKLHHVNGNTVIGFGHEMTDPAEIAQYENGVSEEEASEIMKQDLIKFENIVHEKLAGVPLSQSEFDAIVSLTYNAGDQLGNSTAFVKVLKSKPAHESQDEMNDRYRRAFNGMLAFNKAPNRRTGKLSVWPGLQLRRAGEVFLARRGRAPAKGNPQDVADMKRLYNEGIGRTGIKAHDEKYRGEVWN